MSKRIQNTTRTLLIALFTVTVLIMFDFFLKLHSSAGDNIQNGNPIPEKISSPLIKKSINDHISTSKQRNEILNPSHKQDNIILTDNSKTASTSTSTSLSHAVVNVDGDHIPLSPSPQQQQPQQQSSLNKNIRSNTKSHHKKHSTHIHQLQTCAASVAVGYNTPSSASDANDADWCKQTKQEYGVQIGRSWGRLSGIQRESWETRRCNEIISSGGILACNDRWGWGMFDAWIRTAKPSIIGQSTMSCAENRLTSTYCKLTNVVIDYSKASIHDKTRSFSPGFLTTYGVRTGHTSPAPGHKHVALSQTERVDMQCDETEDRPVFFISHDDIFNIGHHINDVVAVWTMVVLSGRNFSDSLLVNMDGLREGGPAGGPSHRLMLANDPDAWGPYIGYYNSWFGNQKRERGSPGSPERGQGLKRAVEYKQKRVCYSEAYFQPYPGIGWFWNNWGHVDECSVQASSPLYQSFNVFMRQRWEEFYGPGSLPLPPIDHVKIVIEARSINRAKTNNHSTARYIRNLSALLAALKTIPGVVVIIQDFAKLEFKDQVALAHSTGVLLSMHGAGTTHLFHMAVGTPNCCALVELQPEKSIGFQSAVGFGNLARMHGLHYSRYDATDGRTTNEGTNVDVDKIRELVVKAVDAVRNKPTCVFAVKDTSRPVYNYNEIFPL
eukprot:gene6895-13990_t